MKDIFGGIFLSASRPFVLYSNRNYGSMVLQKNTKKQKQKHTKW
jgi:hypothetical protein